MHNRLENSVPKFGQRSARQKHNTVLLLGLLTVEGSLYSTTPSYLNHLLSPLFINQLMILLFFSPVRPHQSRDGHWFSKFAAVWKSRCFITANIFGRSVPAASSCNPGKFRNVGKATPSYYLFSITFHQTYCLC